MIFTEFKQNKRFFLYIFLAAIVVLVLVGLQQFFTVVKVTNIFFNAEILFLHQKIMGCFFVTISIRKRRESAPKQQLTLKKLHLMVVQPRPMASTLNGFPKNTCKHKVKFIYLFFSDKLFFSSRKTLKIKDKSPNVSPRQRKSQRTSGGLSSGNSSNDE
jgi:hypothetical protein